jgi:hypothetical protein
MYKFPAVENFPTKASEKRKLFVELAKCIEDLSLEQKKILDKKAPAKARPKARATKKSNPKIAPTASQSAKTKISKEDVMIKRAEDYMKNDKKLIEYIVSLMDTTIPDNEFEGEFGDYCIEIFKKFYHSMYQSKNNMESWVKENLDSELIKEVRKDIDAMKGYPNERLIIYLFEYSVSALFESLDNASRDRIENKVRDEEGDNVDIQYEIIRKDLDTVFENDVVFADFFNKFM